MSIDDAGIRLRHMLDYAREAILLTHGKSQKDLAENRLLNLALVQLVTMIGEAANHVSEEVQTQHPEIAWPVIVSTRNRLIHGYDIIDFDILWQTITEDLPPLIAALEKIVPPPESEA